LIIVFILIEFIHIMFVLNQFVLIVFFTRKMLYFLVLSLIIESYVLSNRKTPVKRTSTTSLLPLQGWTLPADLTVT
jgi:hypothetical protein